MFLNPCWQHSPALFPFSIREPNEHTPTRPRPRNGYITVHTPACPTQITNDTHFTPNTSTDDDPAPLSLDRFHCWCHLLPCHATPTTTVDCTFTFFPSFFSPTHVSHANTATSVLLQYNRPYHVATLHCTNCSNLRSGSYFWCSVVWSKSL